MDENQAIQNIKQHNLRGLTWLVEQYQVKAVRAAYLICRERAQAEDVVQDAFLDLPDLIQSFDLGRPFEPWFMRVVVNRTLRALSHQRRLVALPEQEETDTWLETWIGSPPGPENQLQQTELEALIWAKMQLLNPKQRAAVVMRYYLQMSEQEMAELAAVPAGTIKWRLSAARRQLRNSLGADPRKEQL